VPSFIYGRPSFTHIRVEQEKNSFGVREILKNPATTQLIARSEEGVVVGLIYVLLSKKFCQSCGTQRLTSLLSLQLQSLPWPD
jgi:hypothetical protein